MLGRFSAGSPSHRPSDYPLQVMSTVSEAARRRTFAVIAHPDAGKSTLTEALALHAHIISEAGAVHGKGCLLYTSPSPRDRG